MLGSRTPQSIKMTEDSFGSGSGLISLKKLLDILLKFSNQISLLPIRALFEGFTTVGPQAGKGSGSHVLPDLFGMS